MSDPVMNQEHVLQFFAYSHLPEHLSVDALNDPAKLANLIAMEARRCGLGAEPCEPFAIFRGQSWPMVQVDDDVYMFRLVSADMVTSRQRLRALHSLPDGAREDAEKILRPGFRL